MPPEATAGVLAGYQPQPLLHYFEELSAIPRPSHHEDRVLDWLKRFAEQRGLAWKQDAARNLVICRPGSGGGEQGPVVALQSHVDMVTEKNEGKQFDFMRDGIQLRVEGDWIKADDTTLGADDGIGVATALALLDARPDAKLPPLEALFTVVEEHGMDGAFGLGEDMLKARYLLNLDTEEWGQLYVGSAGAGATIITLPVQTEPCPPGLLRYDLKVRGLAGGHSGADIEKGFANSVVVVGQVLDDVLRQLPEARVATAAAGMKRNAIPREGTATLMVPAESLDQLQATVAAAEAYLRKSYGQLEPQLSVTVEGGSGAGAPAKEVLTADSGERLAALLATLPNGVDRMSLTVPGLVETSNNLGYVRPQPADGPPTSFLVESYARTMLDGWHLDALRRRIGRVAGMVGAQVEQVKAYPGWLQSPDSELLQITKREVAAVLGHEPTVEAIHAGLECGLISVKYPGLEIVSFGPTILGAHTPEERCQLSTLDPYWRATLRILEALADKRV